MRSTLAFVVLTTLLASGCSSSPSASFPANFDDPEFWQDCQATHHGERLASPPAPEPLHDAVTITPDATLCLLLDPTAPHGVSPVDRAARDKPHVEVKMRIRDNGTALVLRNRSKTPVTYEAGVQVAAGSGWRRTSVLPLYPGIVSYEHWPERLHEIVLVQFRSEGPQQ